jgi:hypothetical protein
MRGKLVFPYYQREALRHVIAGIYPLHIHIPFYLALFHCQRVDRSRLFPSRQLVRLTLGRRELEANLVLCRSLIVGFWAVNFLDAYAADQYRRCMLYQQWVGSLSRESCGTQAILELEGICVMIGEAYDRPSGYSPIANSSLPGFTFWGYGDVHGFPSFF